MVEVRGESSMEVVVDEFVCEDVGHQSVTANGREQYYDSLFALSFHQMIQ